MFIIIIIIIIIITIIINISISNVVLVVVNLQQPVLSVLAVWVLGQAQTSDPVAGQVSALVKHSAVELAVQAAPISLPVYR